MSNYHRSTRWAGSGVNTRSQTSSGSYETTSNKPFSNTTANGSSTGKLLVSCTSQRQQPNLANSTSQTASEADSAFSNSSAQRVNVNSQPSHASDFEQVPPEGGKHTQPFAAAPARRQVDLASTHSAAGGWESYRTDQLVAFPAAIDSESPESQVITGTSTPVGREEDTHGRGSSTPDTAGSNSEQPGQESPIRRGPSSVALASRRLADALENDDVGVLYNAYRDEWSPEPINTAADPSQPMLRRPNSSASILPVSDSRSRRPGSAGASSVTHFSGGEEASQQRQLATSRSASRATLQGVTESGSSGNPEVADGPPPRPPPPSDTPTMSVAGGQLSVAPPSQSTNSDLKNMAGGDSTNIRPSSAGNRQFQGPASRNRKPLVGVDGGGLNGKNMANGRIPNGTGSDGHRTPVVHQDVSDSESAYSVSFVGRNKHVNGTGSIGQGTMPPTAVHSPTSSPPSTMVVVNTAIGQSMIDRSTNTTPSIPNKVSTFMAYPQTTAMTVGQPSNGYSTLHEPTRPANHGHSPATVTRSAYGSRQAVAAGRQSGTATPRYISQSGRSSPRENGYYENSDNYPSAAGQTANAPTAITSGPTDQQAPSMASADPGISGSMDFPPPPTASQDNLLAETAGLNGIMVNHQHNHSIGDAGSVTLDVLQHDRSGSPIVPIAGSPPLLSQGASTPVNHMRHESAPAAPLLSSTPTSISSTMSSHQRGCSHPPAGSQTQAAGLTPSRSFTSTRSKAPWQRKHLYRLCQENGSQSRLLQSIPPQTLDRLGLFLNRFIYRVMAEAKALSSLFNYCSHHEILTAIMLVTPSTIAEGAIGAAVKARLAYTMPTNATRFRTSKMSRCNLILPVARIHQWLISMTVAGVVSECAAVYIAAATEHLGCVIVSRALAESRNAAGKSHNSLVEGGQQQSGQPDSRSTSPQVFTVESLDYAVSCSQDLWSVVQQHPFLVTPKAVPVSSGSSSAGSALGDVRTLDSSTHSLNSLVDGDRGSIKSGQRAPSVASNTTTDSARSTSGTRGPHSRITSQISGSDVFRFPSPGMASVETKEKLLEAIVQIGLDMASPGQNASPYVHSPLPRRRSLQQGGPSSSVILPQSPLLSHGRIPVWGRDGIDTLFYFVSTRLSGGPAQEQKAQLFSSYVKSSKTLPSLTDWVRLATTFAQYRCRPFVSSADVLHVAELLLPGVVSPPFSLRAFSGWLYSTPEDLGENADIALCRLKTDELFISIQEAPLSLVPQLLKLHTENILNFNSQGLSLLMMACADGNQALAEYLATHKPDQLDLVVPKSSRGCPCAMPTIRGWTALHFAVAKGYYSIVKHLLTCGADVEGRVLDMYTLNEVGAAVASSPLQIACAAGSMDIIKILLDHQADPFLAPPSQRLQQDATSAFLSSAFAMAATHGQQEVLTVLLSRPIQSTAKDRVSLTDVLAEAGGTQSGDDSLRHLRSRAMQEALFLAAEHGHIELAQMLREHGVPWTLHSWGEALDSAYHNSMRSQVLLDLLKDFSTVNDTELSSQFCHDALPILLSILRQPGDMSSQAAIVLQLCYGEQILPNMGMVQPPTGSGQLDITWLNNPEMADIVFIAEGRPFYAHRLILWKASNRFQAVLSASPATTTERMTIELPQISYSVLELVIYYIYTGGNSIDIPKHVQIQDVLRAARFFELWRLHQHCEVLAGNTLNVDCVCELYSFAKNYDAPILREACESFFLAHLTKICRKPLFRKLLSETFIEMLRSLVVLRLKQRSRVAAQSSFVTAC